MTAITRLGNVVTTLGLLSMPEPLDEVVLLGLGEFRDDYDVEAIAGDARAVIEGALPDGWQEEVRDALDADTLAEIWARHEIA